MIPTLLVLAGVYACQGTCSVVFQGKPGNIPFHSVKVTESEARAEIQNSCDATCRYHPQSYSGCRVTTISCRYH